LERKVKDILAMSCGANEIFNYSFIDKTLLQKIGQTITQHIELVNPWTENQNLMRRSLLPQLLKNVSDNLRFYEDINIFHIGKTFISELPGPEAKPGSGEFLPCQDLWAAGAVNCEDTFYAGKDIVETILNALGIKFEYDYLDTADAWVHPKQSLAIVVGKEVVGYISTLHPSVANSLEINRKTGIWQLNLNKLVDFYPAVKKYEQLPKFPSVELDLSVLLNDDIQWKDLQNLVRAIDNQLIKKVDLLDVYKSDKIESGKKSMTFRITYQSLEKTLEMEAVNKLQEKVINQLEKALGAEVRK